MNVKQLREFLDREESLWTEERKKWFGDFDLTSVVIDTLTGYSEMEGMYLGEISSIMFYPVAGAKVETKKAPVLTLDSYANLFDNTTVGCGCLGDLEDI
jgi:hypothetical protein